MQKDAIEGINRIGKLGFILTIIVSVACYIFMIYAIGLAIIIHNAPESLATITIGEEVTIDMDLSDTNLDGKAVKTLQSYIDTNDANISVGSLIMYLSSKENTESGGRYVFGGVSSKFSFRDLWVACVYVIILLAATCVMLVFNGMFARTLKKCKSPFEEGVIHDLSVFSVILVVWGFVVAAIKALLESIVTGYAKIGISGVLIIVLCMVVFCFSKILKYASELN